MAYITERKSSHRKICQKVQLLLASKMQANCFLCFSPKPAELLRFTKRILHTLRNLPVLKILLITHLTLVFPSVKSVLFVRLTSYRDFSKPVNSAYIYSLAEVRGTIQMHKLTRALAKPLQNQSQTVTVNTIDLVTTAGN